MLDLLLEEGYISRTKYLELYQYVDQNYMDTAMDGIQDEEGSIMRCERQHRRKKWSGRRRTIKGCGHFVVEAPRWSVCSSLFCFLAQHSTARFPVREDRWYILLFSFICLVPSIKIFSVFLCCWIISSLWLIIILLCSSIFFFVHHNIFVFFNLTSIEMSI